VLPGCVIIYNQMVVDRLDHEQTDRVFHALADVTRRDIVLRALQGEHSVSALARHYPMSVAAVQKHVAVLEGAGLVTKQRRGREQLVRSNVDTIRKAYQLLEQLEAVWRGRINRIGELLADEQTHEQKEAQP
jgi:DNA-binding transcriptional ArsR family regulator